MSSEEGHKYTQYGFNGTYWANRERAFVDTEASDMLHVFDEGQRHAHNDAICDDIPFLSPSAGNTYPPGTEEHRQYEYGYSGVYPAKDKTND